MSILQNSIVPASAGGYEIANSLRFNDDDSAYLSRTPASAGNRKTWTWSAWVQRGNLGITTFVFGAGSTGRTDIYFSDADKFKIAVYQGMELEPTAVFRDPSAWYHILIAMDTTQSTASNRTKMYINGELQTSFTTASYPTQNDDLQINNSVVHRLGARGYNTSNTLDGYLSEVNLIDGQALDPSNFGETGDYGEWKPIKYTGTYGTNGFYLDFKNSGSLGNDVSGAGNNWTPNNLAATDQMLDSPTNNFATLNPLDPATGTSVTLSEGNLKNVGSTVSYSGAVGSTFTVTSGKWYWEVHNNTEVAAGTNVYTFVGCAVGFDNNIHKANNSNIPSVASGVDGWSWESDGDVRAIGTGITRAVTTVSNPSAGDVLGFAMDLDNGNVYFYLNGVAENSGSAVITGVTGLANTPMVGVYNGSASMFNFGQDSSFAGNKTAQGNADDNGIGDFYYSVPTGYLALCTQNLSDPAASLWGT